MRIIVPAGQLRQIVALEDEYSPIEQFLQAEPPELYVFSGHVSHVLPNDEEP